MSRLIKKHSSGLCHVARNTSSWLLRANAKEVIGLVSLHAGQKPHDQKLQGEGINSLSSQQDVSLNLATLQCSS